MNAIYAVLICLTGALICAMLRQQKPEFAAVVALAAGTAAIMICAGDISTTATAVKSLADSAGLGAEYTQILLRACGVAVIAEFAMQICMDAGESALAGRIKLALRLGLLGMSLPLLADVLAKASQLLSL